MSDKIQSHTLLEKLEGKKIERSFGDGVVFDHVDAHKNKHRLKSVVRLKDGELREANLDVFSWRASIGAVHFYAKIETEFHSYVHASNGKPYNSMVGSDAPFGADRLSIEMMRLVDKRDLKHDKDEAELRGDTLLYGRMKPGDWTHGFWTEEEAKQAAIQFFKSTFGPGWKLVSEYEEGIFATT